MRRLSLALFSAVSVVAFTQIASAADLGRPVYKAPPPPPPPVADWSGVYVGIEGGYGWGHQSIDPAFSPDMNAIAVMMEWIQVQTPSPSIGSVHQNGWLFGGFAGVQKQWGSWVLGIEGDFDGADIKGSAESSVVANGVPCQLGGSGCTVTRSLSIDSKIDELGSVRGKVGWSFAPNWLLYGTGGLAFAHVKEDATLNQDVIYDLQPWPETTSASGGASRLGWAAGAGLDWKLPVDAGSAWVFGVEYLHYEFPADTITLADNLGYEGSFAINTKQSVDTVKGRISYLFSIH